MCTVGVPCETGLGNTGLELYTEGLILSLSIIMAL